MALHLIQLLHDILIKNTGWEKDKIKDPDLFNSFLDREYPLEGWGHLRKLQIL